MKKRRRKPNLSDPSSRTWRDKCDRLWAKLIRSTGKCAIDNEDCKGPLNAHHLISREIKVLRHNLANGVCLCASHHKYNRRLSAHRGVPGFARWMTNNRPETWLWAQEVIATAKEIKKPDYESRYKFLTEIEELRDEDNHITQD